jgi:hypothetical protein
VVHLLNLQRARKQFRRSSLNILQGLAYLVLALLVPQSARAQKITMEFDQTMDFSKYKTFAIRDGQLSSRNPALNSPLVKKQIEADIQHRQRSNSGDQRPLRPQCPVHVWRRAQDRD